MVLTLALTLMFTLGLLSGNNITRTRTLTIYNTPALNTNHMVFLANAMAHPYYD